WEFSPGEEVHVLVTSVDVDGNKSKISASTPLVFTDTFGPVMEDGQENWWDYPDTVREGTNSITTDAIVYFHEDMDTNDPAAAPVLASVSGAGTFTAGTGTWWSRDTWASEGITFDINVPSTTLSQAYYPSQTYLKVADASGFGQWDYILIGEPGTANWMDQTICDINTLENLIVLCGTSAYAYPSGSVVRLIEQDDNNASDFVAELANPVIIGDNSITLAAGQGAKFYPGMGVEVYAMDDSMWPSWVYVGWLDVDSISGDTINLGSSSTFVAAAGSKVVFDNLGWVPYHDLRGTQEFNGAGQILADIVLDASSLTTTIAANTQNNSIGGSDPNPQKIVVQSSAGFQSNDIIYIEGTYISKTATTGTDGGGAVNTLDVGTNHGFMEGDRVIIREKDVSANLSAAVANGANSITLASSVEVVSGEPATLTSDPFITRMSAAAVAAATDISVSSVTGLVVGMNITIDDGNQGIVTRNITAIAGTTLTLDLALGLDFAADTVVQRGTWSEVVNIDPAGTAGTALVAGTTVAVSTLVLNHPASARLEVNRTSQQLNVTVVNGSVITLSANLGWHHKPKVDLLSAMERRTVWYVEDEYTIMLTTGLNYGHHPGAAVRRHNTAVVKLNQDLWTARVGDTIIMDNDGQTWTTGDRYEVTLESINSIDNTITISVPRSGVIYNDTVRLTFMGDAIHVSGAADKQGNVMGTATGTSGTAYTFNRGHLLNMASGIVR
ncbi:MAG: hypothetical protein OEZ59_06125, partial [Deltaproteobacteria bacterium]|nr:hypothetical protein [Deltaproteobacteria bacterium]